MQSRYLQFFNFILGIFILSMTSTAQDHSFIEDVELLDKHYAPLVLKQGKARVALLAELQGRVMTSSSTGDSGLSYGWFNYDLIANNAIERNSVAGGSDRLWFGPEAGPYAIFFEQGTPQTVSNIKVPEAISTQPYNLVKHTDTSAHFQQVVNITNYQGFEFKLDVNRYIDLLNSDAIASELNVAIPADLSMVAHKATTEITNIGKDWRKETGLLAIWDLGAFLPSPQNTAVIPVRDNPGKVVEYFSPIVDTHTRVTDTHVFYLADAEYMNKIGIPPEHTINVMGAWDPQREVLTLVNFSFTPDQGDYVSAIWGERHVPYEGDVVNVFNDGDPNGTGPFGPFYELETLSHARPLKHGESLSHVHTTYHFEGERDQLSVLAERVLGVSINDIEKIFAKN